MTRTFYVPKGIDYDKQLNTAKREVEKKKKVAFHNHGITEKNCNDRCWTNIKPK